MKHTLTDRQQVIAGVLAREGIIHPALCLVTAKRAELDVPTAAALLLMETAGGRMIYGHDAVANRAPKGGEVTKANYLGVYLPDRKRGLGMQGVGDTQLTWFAYQDEADKLGGCWRQGVNRYVGFKLMVELIRTNGRATGVARYNGSGAAATAYSVRLRWNARRISRRVKRTLRREGMR
jgi:hypothetical protein